MLMMDVALLRNTFSSHLVFSQSHFTIVKSPRTRTRRSLRNTINHHIGLSLGVYRPPRVVSCRVVRMTRLWITKKFHHHAIAPSFERILASLSLSPKGQRGKRKAVRLCVCQQTSACCIYAVFIMHIRYSTCWATCRSTTSGAREMHWIIY
jgi:hypothetical protein